jgi:hypothetical protein
MITFFIYGCKRKNDDYEIIKRTKIISKNNCQIKISYPEIKGLADIEKMSRLNKVLEEWPEHEYYAKNCEHKEDKKDAIIGEYQILLKTDSILSIEFRTLIPHENLKPDTIYHSVVVNPKQSYKSKNGIVGIEPEQIIPNFNRGMIFPYIEKYSVKNKKHINLLAYKTGSNYIITWAISKNDFIVYVGGEGEWFGENKIIIPLNKLK